MLVVEVCCGERPARRSDAEACRPTVGEHGRDELLLARALRADAEDVRGVGGEGGGAQQLRLQLVIARQLGMRMDPRSVTDASTRRHRPLARPHPS